MSIRTGNLSDLAVTPGDFTIGEFEGGVWLVCPVCGPLLWAGGLGGLSLPAVQRLADRHAAAKHDPGRFPHLSSPGGGV